MTEVGLSLSGKNLAVLVSTFGWYENRLQYVASFLEQKGYEVVILTTDFNHGKKEQIKNRYEQCTYIHVPPYSKNISLTRIRSHYSFAKQVRKQLESLQPSLIYVLVPPNCVIDQCAKYKSSDEKALLFADIIDLWPESLVKGRLPTPVRSMWRGMRAKGLAESDYVFTECDLYRERISEELPDNNVSTLRLCKPVIEPNREYADTVRKLREATRGSSNDSLRLGYVGSMNHILDIEGVAALIKAVTQNVRALEVHVIGDGESRDEFLEAMERAGADVTYYGRIYDQEEKIGILGACDYGINMMRKGVNVGLTIKSVDYLSMGLPIINNIEGDTWSIVEKELVGLNIERDNLQPAVESLSSVDSIPAYQQVVKCFKKFFSTSAFQENLSIGLNAALDKSIKISE